MPTYQFKCRKCNETFDRIALIAERNMQVCGKCGQQLERMFAPPRHVSVFRPDWYWMGSNERVFVSSKRELFAECKKRGKYSVGYGQENELTEEQHRQQELPIPQAVGQHEEAE